MQLKAHFRLGGPLEGRCEIVLFQGLSDQVQLFEFVWLRVQSRFPLVTGRHCIQTLVHEMHPDQLVQSPKRSVPNLEKQRFLLALAQLLRLCSLQLADLFVVPFVARDKLAHSLLRTFDVLSHLLRGEARR